MRAYKTVNDTYIEPISFTVPRRAETFQADIFPPATGTKPVSGVKEWLDGKTGIPAKIDLESVYDGSAPREVPSDYKPPSAVARSEPSRDEAPKEAPRPAAVAARGSPPSVQEQKRSMAAMASKFRDDEGAADDDDDDETSSFEEVSRPAQRTAATAATARPEPRAAASPPAGAQPPSLGEAAAATPAPAAATWSGPPGRGVESSLDEIKHMIEEQTRFISAQNDRIGHLAAEVESLKRKVGSASQDQSERIRQLELELEEARS